MVSWRLALALTFLAPSLAYAAAGGPDASGYRWADHSEEGGPQFAYEAVNGPRVAFSDDSVAGPYNIGFTFRYYGQNYTQFWVSSNGFMTLSRNTASGCCSGSPLGGGRGYAAMIAGFWTDLLGSAGTYQTRGEAGRRVLVFQQQGREYSRGPSVQYQIKLFEASGAVEIHIRTAGVASHNAAIGIQDHTRGVGLTYRSGRVTLNNTAVRFSHNSPPVLARLDPIQVYHGQRIAFVMSITESDGDEVALTVEGLPEAAVFNPLNGKFRWTPTPADEGQHDLIFRAVEQRNDQQQPLSDESQVQITVLGLNQPPQISSLPSETVIQGETFEYTVVAVDVDSEDPVTCRLGEAPQGALLEGCTLSWQATARPGSEHLFRLRATDSEGASTGQSFSVLVQSHPEAPVAVIAVESEEVGPGWLTLDGSGSDPGRAESVTYDWAALAWPEGTRLPRMENVAAPQARALLTLRGEYRFGLQVAAASLQSVPAEQVVRVVNVAPLAVVSEGESFDLSEGGERFVILRGSDSVDPNPEDQIECLWSQAGGPEAELEQDGFDATVALREFGTLTFELVCSDGELESEPGVVEITVVNAKGPEPDAPRTPAPSGCFNITGSQSFGLLFAVWLVGRRRRTFPRA